MLLSMKAAMGTRATNGMGYRDERMWKRFIVRIESCGKEAGGSKMSSSPNPCFPCWAVTKHREAIAKEMLPKETWTCGGFSLGG